MRSEIKAEDEDEIPFVQYLLGPGRYTSVFSSLNQRLLLSYCGFIFCVIFLINSEQNLLRLEDQQLPYSILSGLDRRGTYVVKESVEKVRPCWRKCYNTDNF